jgi:hypothetical protein
MPARAKKYTDHELGILVGSFMIGFGLRTPSDIGAVTIEAKHPKHLEYLAKMFGGEVRPFEDKRNKTWYGWFVPKERKLELFKELDSKGLLENMDSVIRYTIEYKLGGAKRT